MLDKHIQPIAPELLEPLSLTKPSDDRGAYRIVGPDEGTAEDALSQSVVTEPTQSPYLRAVIGSVDAGGHIATIGVVVMVIATQEARITTTSAVSVLIVMVVGAKHTRVAVAGLPAARIIVVVPTQEAGIAMASLPTVGIVMVVSAKEARIAAANLLTVPIIVRVTTKSIGAAVSLFRHILYLQNDVLFGFLTPIYTQTCPIEWTAIDERSKK